MPMTMEQIEAELGRLGNKLLSLEESFAKTHDPKAKETIADLRAQVEALTKKLDKAKEENPPAPATPPAPPPGAPAGAAAAAPGGKKKSFLQKWHDEED